jgi:predicted metal-dependent enzyme (double-stranded beta helix superfamily)
VSGQQLAVAEVRRNLARARKRPLPVSLDRELDETELLELAHALAERPELWQHLKVHDPETRTYAHVMQNDHLEAYLICWMDGHDTGFHDHDISRGALAVVQGEVREDRLTIGGPPSSRLLARGQSVTFGAADIHRVQHSGDAPAVTLHVYSPPIRQMGQYEIEPGGTLKRHPRGSGDELAPVEEVIPA